MLFESSFNSVETYEEQKQEVRLTVRPGACTEKNISRSLVKGRDNFRLTKRKKNWVDF